MIALGYDPQRLVTVSPAERPGQYAIVSQPVQRHHDDNGQYIGHSWLSLTVEGSDWRASNTSAIALAEKLNNGMEATHDSTDSEHDDG